MVSSTGRLATWWTSSDVVLVPEDVTQWVSLEQRACSERQQANQEEMLHCCLEGGSFKANVEMEEMEGIASVRSPAKRAALLCWLPSKTEHGFWLSFSFCSLFFFFFPFFFHF